jgi:hypothetical protein
MASSVGWTVAADEDETRSTRSPEATAGDEKEEDAMMARREKREEKVGS